MLRNFFCSPLIMSTQAAVKIEKTSYAGWPNCYRITNGEVELIVTTDVGPRIMRYGFVGGQNLFKEFKDQLGKTGEKEWQARGGHRIWIAPELVPDTYALDNAPIKAVIQGDTLETTQAVERETGLEKQIIIKLAPSGSNVEVIHRIKNTSAKPRDYAPWALTMMAQGGTGIHGFPPRGTHPEGSGCHQPAHDVGLHDLSDPRWKFTKKYMMLRQDPKATTPQKLGSFNPADLRSVSARVRICTLNVTRRRRAIIPTSAVPSRPSRMRTSWNWKQQDRCAPSNRERRWSTWSAGASTVTLRSKMDGRRTGPGVITFT
jgi:hypothetical protein